MDGMINMKRILSFVLLLSIVISCKEKLTPEVDFSEGADQREYDKVTMVIPPLSFDDDEQMTKVIERFKKLSDLDKQFFLKVATILVSGLDSESL